MKDTLEKRIAGIKLLGSDVDGVLTDGRLYLGEHGQEFKAFSSRDGLGLMLAGRMGLQLALITGRESFCVERRAQELKVKEVHMGIKDKVARMKEIWQRLQIQPHETAYIGDDLNDIPLLQEVGLACTVSDGAPEVQNICHYITRKPGGRGAVRELVELILKAQGRWPY